MVSLDSVLLLTLTLLAAELGWVVAEYGRQPWVVQGILPTFMGTSSLSPAQVWTSITGFIVFYTIWPLSKCI